MSNSSKYSGLAGTIVLGTLLGLNYTQYARRKSPLSEKAGSYNPDEEVKPGAFYDKDGHVVPFGQTNLPGSDFVRNLRDILPDISPLFVCAALSGLWAIRTFGSMNKVLNRRYSDVVYQIRRPDVIANRLTAWKYLGLGGLLIPAAAGGYIMYALKDKEHLVSEARDVAKSMSSIAEESQRLGALSALHLPRGALADSISELSRTLRDGFKP